MIENVVKIHGVCIKFAMESQLVAEYVSREIEQYTNNKVYSKEENVDMFINFYNKKFRLPANYYRYNAETICYGNNIAICIRAHFRHTWIVVKKDPIGKFIVSVYLDLKDSIGSEIKKVFTLNFLYPWQNSIIDFFHGIYLILLQEKLFEQQAIIVHAAAMFFKNRGFVLTADAASGKSTLVDLAVKKHGFKFIAEDYCIIDRNSVVTGVFNQRRIGQEHIPDRKKTVSSVANYMFCELMRLMGKERIRICSIDELFEEEEIIRDAKMDAIYFLNRGNEEANAKKISTTMLEIMKREIANWEGANSWLFCCNYQKVFWEKYQAILSDICSINREVVWNIPFYKSIDEFVLDVITKIDKEV